MSRVKNSSRRLWMLGIIGCMLFKSTLAKATMMMFLITLHNIPYGMAVGMVCAVFLSCSAFIVPAMLYLVRFVAGAMMYVVVEELISEMSEFEHSKIGVMMLEVGFTLMAALYVA